MNLIDCQKLLNSGSAHHLFLALLHYRHLGLLDAMKIFHLVPLTHVRVTPALDLPVIAFPGSQRKPSVTEDPPLDACADFEPLSLTPFDQTKFFPDFVHVNVKLLDVTFCPDIVHFVPAFGDAAFALVGVEISESAMKDEMMREVTFFEGVNFIG